MLEDEKAAVKNLKAYQKSVEENLLQADVEAKFTIKDSQGNIISDDIDTTKPNSPWASYLHRTLATAQYEGQSMTFELRIEGNAFTAWTAMYTVISLALLGLVLFLFYFFVPRILKPADQFFVHLKSELHRLASGEAGEPIPIFDDDIFGELAAAYRKLRETLGEGVLEIRRTNALLNGILESMRDGVMVLNEDGRLVVWTERAMELLGEDSPGQKSLERIDDESEAPLLAVFGGNCYMLANLIRERSKDLKIGETTNALIRLHWPRAINLDLYIRAIEVDSQRNLLVVLHDKTRVVQLENYRRDFVANITHELKTPLTSIQGYTELLLRAPRDEETQKLFLETIDQETKRLSALIQDLLLLAEIETREEVKTQSVTPVLPVLESCLRTQKVEAEKRELILHHNIQPGDTLPLSPDSLRQILVNLLSNAVRYIQKGGRVDVLLDETPTQKKLIVQDNGPGIPPEHQARIFERFYRVHKERSRELGGTGLGLSIVKHLTESAGGTVELQSSVEGVTGTCFILSFPKEHPRQKCQMMKLQQVKWLG